MKIRAFAEVLGICRICFSHCKEWYASRTQAKAQEHRYELFGFLWYWLHVCENAHVLVFVCVQCEDAHLLVVLCVMSGITRVLP